MPTVKIIRAMDNVFPEQQAKLTKDILTIKTYKGGEKIYPIKNSIVSLDIVSQHWRNTLFDIELCDGAQFRGEAGKGIVHRLAKFTGASPHKVEERTAQQVRQQARWTAIRWVGIPLLLMFLVMMTSDPNLTPSKYKRFVGPGQYACTVKDYYDKIVQVAAQDDHLAFAKLVATGVAAGICTKFNINEQVYITDSGFILVKIRRPGETVEYWTDSGFVK